MSTKDLKKILPIKFRLGSWVWRATTVTQNWKEKKLYDNYLCLAYVDARDVMDHLDKVVWPDKRQKKYESIDGKIYCWIWLKFWQERVWKRDVGEKSNISADKWAASDAFKRAAVCRGVWRYLYSMPKLELTQDEVKEYTYATWWINKYTRKKYYEELKEWAAKHESDIQDSEYDDDEPLLEPPSKTMDDIVDIWDRES